MVLCTIHSFSTPPGVSAAFDVIKIFHVNLINNTHTSVFILRHYILVSALWCTEIEGTFFLYSTWDMLCNKLTPIGHIGGMTNHRRA
jgi:hypothetical protein